MTTNQTLNDGRTIPALGLGVFQVPPGDTQRVVEEALEVGYRHIDTAAAYVNEAGVGAAIRAMGLARDQVYVTTKLRNGDQGRHQPKQALRDSLERLGMDYVDLYLIHWPNPSAGLYVDSWLALEELHGEGVARSIGLSNFLPHHYAELRAAASVVPAVNQVELHPTYQQADVVEAMGPDKVVVEAYSPLGQGADLSDATVEGVAAESGLTAAQVIIAWHLAHGRVVIPKTTRRERLVENLAASQATLTADQLERLDALDSGSRIGSDPNTFSISQIRTAAP